MKWRDTSSYSYADSHPRTPKSWSLLLKGLPSVVVTRHIHIAPDEWLVRVFDAEQVLKGNKTAEEAQRFAEAQVRAVLFDALAALESAS